MRPVDAASAGRTYTTEALIVGPCNGTRLDLHSEQPFHATFRIGTSYDSHITRSLKLSGLQLQSYAACENSCSGSDMKALDRPAA
jgi:hypothetical protein